MAASTKEDTVCKHCKHKLTEHWEGGCGCKRSGEFIIECGCPSYFPTREKHVQTSFSKYNVEDAKLTILRELGY